MEEERIVERQNSIKVSRNAKGEFAHEVKIYWDERDRTNQNVVEEIRSIYDKLHTNFK